MVPFHVFATLHFRSASSPPNLRVLRELCVEIPTYFGSQDYTSLKPSTKPDPKNSFQISTFRTLSFSVSSKSFVCHSYENCRVYTNNSHSGTHPSPLITLHSIQVLSFHALPHSFARTKNSTPFFSSDSTLFAKNTRGGGRGHSSGSTGHWPRNTSHESRFTSHCHPRRQCYHHLQRGIFCYD